MNLESRLLTGIATLLLLGSFPLHAAPDAAAAQALARKSFCFTCHAIDKKKIGPAFKEVAAKYKGKADAEQKLYVHLTTKPMVDVGGSKEEHSSLKTNNEADVRNVVQWILSQ